MLFLWAALSGFFLWRSTKKLRRQLAQATNHLQQSPDALSFAGSFEAVSQRFTGLSLIASPWNGFRQSLIVPTQPGRPVTSTADPRQWFDLSALLRAVGCDPRYHAALPGLLVGAGLLFTFLGLAAALSAAGGVVAEHVSQTERNAALQDLLGAASVKFVASIAGLSASIGYAVFRKFQLRQAERSMDRFLTALDERLPFRSAASLQAEANQVLANQYAEMQRIGADFFVNLGGLLETKFGEGLQEHIGPLSAAIEKLSGGLANQNEDAMKTMLGAFLDRLQGSVGENMSGTAATLEKLGGSLDSMQAGLDAAAQKMGRAAEEMAAGMGRGTQTAMAGISQQMDALVSSLREAAEEAGRSNRAAGDDLARQMAETAASLTNAAALFQTRMEAGAADGVARLTGPIEAMLQQLSHLAEAQREAGAQSTSALSATIARAADALEATAAKVADTLGGGAADASQRLVAATEAMRDDLRGVLDKFGGSLTESGTALTNSARAGGDALLGAASALGADLGGAAMRLREAGEAAGSALREGGAEARSGMTEAARIVLQATSNLAERLAGLGAASAALAEQAAALNRAAGSATVPLVTSAADLRAAGEAAREATAPLRDVAQTVREAALRLSEASAALTDWQRGATTLAASVGTAAERFNGLDQGLANTLRGLNDGLGGFRQQITTFVSEMDRGLTRSVEGLTAVARSLEDTAGELSVAR